MWKNGRYYIHTPTPDDIPCAICGFEVTSTHLQKRKHLLMGCGCSRCRHNHDGATFPSKQICKWCQKSGSCKSFNPSHHLAYISTYNAIGWVVFQKKFGNIQTPIIQCIIQNWNKNLHFECIITMNCGAGYSYLSPKILKDSFYRSWIQSQMFQNRGKISVCYFRTKIDKRFFNVLKTITFARLFICNFFSSCPRKMIDAMHRRLLANVKLLFEVSLLY
jgi:hypothetical protein